MKKLCSILLLAMSVFILRADAVKVNPGQAAVVPANPEARKAAETLRDYLKLVSGVDIPVQENAGDRAFVFRLGIDAKLPPESFKWEVSDTEAVLTGAGARALNFAVYDFLEANLQLRWIRPGDTAYRQQETFEFAGGSREWQPKYRIRTLRGGVIGGKTTNQELKEFEIGPEVGKQRLAELVGWQEQMRMGTHDAPVYGHAFMNYWNRYGQEHPEYFALNSYGKRAPAPRNKAQAENPAATSYGTAASIKMCTSSEALIKQLITNWDRKRPYINVCENDSPPVEYCRCENCRKLDATLPGENFESHMADRYVYLTNKVAETAAALDPAARATMYAYNETEQPPRRTRVSPWTTVGIVPTVFDLKQTEALLKGWRDMGANETFWRPNQHVYFATGAMPFGFEKHFHELIQLAGQYGVIGFDYDSLHHNWGATGLSDYIMARTMAEPDKSFDYWMRHYLVAFGGAAPEMDRYFQYWRENVWEKRIAPDLIGILEKGRYFNFVRGMMWNLKNYYNEGDFDTTDAILQDALKKDLNGNERARLEEFVLTNRHARLLYRAVAQKNSENSLALLDFRRQNKEQPFLNWVDLFNKESYWGDVAGTNEILVFKDFAPPYLQTPLFWHFQIDPDDVGVKEEWMKKPARELVKWDMMPTNNFWETPYKHYPHPSAETRKLTANYDGIAWYFIRIKVPKDWQDRKVFLYFGAVDESCWLYVNGQEAGSRIHTKPNDWTTPFTLEITGRINWAREDQDIMVRVEDTTGTGGIWKRVNLVSTR